MAKKKTSTNLADDTLVLADVITDEKPVGTAGLQRALEYIKENALDESILLIFTNLSNDLKIEKEYGKIKSGSTIMKICN